MARRGTIAPPRDPASPLEPIGMTREWTAIRVNDRAVVCARCVVAETPLQRMKGLLGRSGLAEDEGLLLRPASSIHTWFMRFPIDAVFLDRELTVVGIAEALRPWRFAARR